MTDRLTLALPSKGRLMDSCLETLAKAGFVVSKNNTARDYRGTVQGRGDIEIHFVSASEIAQLLRQGDIHLGVTGEDLMREATAEVDHRVSFANKLGFGHADVVVAVPACWLDVRNLADLEPMAMRFRRQHGRRIRVATKYLNLTRHYFARAGVISYRIVESLGATEGAPAAGLAELIVDITSTGATLRANGLKVLTDGVLLKSEANLIRSKSAKWTPELDAAAVGITRAVAGVI
jgi:ATP phosphoribosyltransferase